MANQKITELALIGGIDVSNDMIPIVDVSVAAGVGETKKVAPSQLKVALALDNVSNTSDANKPVSTATQTALDTKVDENAAITGATKTKITYDAKGLVTAGADLAASDLPTGIDAAKISSGVISNAEFDYLNGLTDNIQTQLGGKQAALTLTTTGSSGAATLVGATLNIPQYSGGGGGGGSGTVTSVAALTLGTTGTDLSSSVANSTTTPVITLNVPTASAANRGAVSSTDWSTFNAKQAALVSGTNIKTVNSTSLLGSGNVAVEPPITATTSADYYRGDKTFATLNKAAVGLGNVDNTSDANKPVSTATQTALDAKTNKLIVTNRQTASYTLVLGDADKLVEINNASANNLTVPLNSSVAFATGTQILLAQYGAGQTTIVATSGVTIRSNGAKLKLNAQYSGATLVKIGENEWYLFGDIA
jgi:hypothetical protein